MAQPAFEVLKLIFAVTLLLNVVQNANSQPCSVPNIRSNSAGNLHWPPGSTASIYIDPSFSNTEIADIKAAAQAWKDTGAFTQVNFLTVDPGATAGNNNIRIMQGGSNFIAETQLITTASAGQTSSVMTGADISFNRGKKNPDGTNVYSEGKINGGDSFLTTVMEHELGHALGLDDYLDSNGNEIDSQFSSIMGFYRGTNNQGIAPTSQTLYAPPGNASIITTCDRDVVISNQTPNPPITGGGGSGGGCGRGRIPVVSPWTLRPMGEMGETLLLINIHTSSIRRLFTDNTGSLL